MKKFIIIISLLFIIYSQQIAGYSPEISGRLETGDRYDTEYAEEAEEVYADYYDFVRIWLRYRQQLAPGEYYFIRGQYFKRDNRERTYYSNITWDLWTNFTFYLTDEIRNRINFDIKDKDYYQSPDRYYRNYNLKYQLEYDYSNRHQYSFYIQRRWQNHHFDSDSNNVRDVFSFDWDYEVTSNFDLKTNLRLDKVKFDPESESTNKYGRRISFNFRYRP